MGVGEEECSGTGQGRAAPLTGIAHGDQNQAQHPLLLPSTPTIYSKCWQPLPLLNNFFYFEEE